MLVFGFSFFPELVATSVSALADLLSRAKSCEARDLLVLFVAAFGYPNDVKLIQVAAFWQFKPTILQDRQTFFHHLCAFL